VLEYTELKIVELMISSSYFS